MPEEPFEELLVEEMEKESYFRMVDEEGKTIVITGRRLRVGDKYLNSDNRLYEVHSVDGYLARARFVEEIKHQLSRDTAPISQEFMPVQTRTSQIIAIYHSHNAESYVPSDGTDSIYGKGGIHDVGAAFRDALEDKDINVLYSERLHLPHDRGAYRRSRITAQELLRQGPDAIFDVHRDAAPWEAYAMEIDGEIISQIQFVVGLSSPGSAANRKLAFDLKGHGDRIHPDLIRGVFLIWGGYNQDLSPMSLLLEVGAHTNTKESAIKGITLFADVVGFYFYGPDFVDDRARDRADRDPEDEDALPPALYRDAGGISGAISGTVIGLLLTSLGAVVGFYFLNNPGALENLLDWWEHLPETAALTMSRWKKFIRDFPQLSRKVWSEAPENLLQGWKNLQIEAKDFPPWLQGKVDKGLEGAQRLAEAAKRWGQGLPGNLQGSWRFLIQESKEFPDYLSRYFNAFKNNVLGVIRWLRRKVPGTWAYLRVNIARGWAESLAEGRRLAELIKESVNRFVFFIREKLSRLRKRLRP